jgi:hypothetical protein
MASSGLCKKFEKTYLVADNRLDRAHSAAAVKSQECGSPCRAGSLRCGGKVPPKLWRLDKWPHQDFPRNSKKHIWWQTTDSSAPLRCGCKVLIRRIAGSTAPLRCGGDVPPKLGRLDKWPRQNIAKVLKRHIYFKTTDLTGRLRCGGEVPRCGSPYQP